MKIQNIRTTGFENAVQVLHAQILKESSSDSNFGLYPDDQIDFLVEHHLLKYGIEKPTEEEELCAYIDAIPYKDNDFLYYASIGPNDMKKLLNNTKLLSLIRFSGEITAKPQFFETFAHYLDKKVVLVHLPMLDRNNYEEESYYFELNYADLLSLCTALQKSVSEWPAQDKEMYAWFLKVVYQLPYGRNLI